MERFKKIMEIPQFVQNPIGAMKEHVANTILLEEKKEKLKQMAKVAHLVKDPESAATGPKWKSAAP